MKSKILLMAAVFLLVLNTACGSAATSAPTQASSAAMPAATETAVPSSALTAIAQAIASSGFPTGSFKPNHPVHTKTLVLNPDGTYASLGIVENGQTAALPKGTFQVTGDHVTFLESSDSISVCPKETGEYTWSFQGSNLVFKLVNDECSERKTDWINSTWTKRP